MDPGLSNILRSIATSTGDIRPPVIGRPSSDHQHLLSASTSNPHLVPNVNYGGGHRDRQRLEQDRKDLELDNDRAWGEFDRMRKWKDRLHADNNVLQVENDGLRRDLEQATAREAEAQAEVRRLKERYEDVLRDKVMLAEQLSGPATLPLEILLNVAGFVAGDNNYGTLLNFSLMSKRINEEFKPVLYETLPYPDTPELPIGRLLELCMQTPGTYKQPPKHHERYEFTKFVFISDAWRGAGYNTRFPNLRATFRLHPRGGKDWAQPAAEEEGYTSFQVEISLEGPIRSHTLLSLLSCPVKWVDNRKSIKYHPIRGIERINFGKNGAVRPSESGDGPVAFRNLVDRCLIGTSSDGTQYEAFCESLRQLVNFLPVEPAKWQDGRPGGFAGSPPSVLLIIEGDAELDAWVRNLPSVLAQRPRLYNKIMSAGTITRAQFRDQMLAAAGAYRHAWQRVKHDMKIIARGERDEFFVMDYQYDPRLDEVPGGNGPPFYLKGTLRYARATNSFVCEITEARDETQRGNTVFEEAYAVGDAV